MRSSPSVLLLLLLPLALTGCPGGAPEVAPRPSPQPGEAARSSPTMDPTLPAVIVLGDSLTAGYGLAADQAFPALLEQRIAERELPFRVVNAGVSGDTSAGGAARLDWLLRQPVAVLVVALGANDGLRGLPLRQTEEFLDEILTRTREAHPDADLVVAGMQMPPSLGEDYTRRFREIYPRLAERHGATLMPFLLEGVAAVPELNQADGIHPTAEGQRRIAERVWQLLEPILQRRAASSR